MRLLITCVAVIALLVAAATACGGDDDVSVADFEGSWDGTSYVLSANDNPEVEVDLVAMGAVLSVEADDSGNFTGDLEVPEALGGPMILPFNAVFELVDQETLKLTFVEEIPPLLRARFRRVMKERHLDDNLRKVPPV